MDIIKMQFTKFEKYSMKVMALISMTVTLMGLAACSRKATFDYMVPDTNIYISFPTDWQQMKQKDVNNAMEKLGARSDTPADYKHAMAVLKQFKRYTFINPHYYKKNHRSLSLMILSKKTGDIDLDAVVESQANTTSKMTGNISVALNNCPKPALANYRCYSATAKMYGSKQTEYHYLTLDKGVFVEFGIGVRDSQDLDAIKGIISSIRIQKKDRAN